MESTIQDHSRDNKAIQLIPNEKRPLGRPKQRCIDRVRSDMQILEVINSIELANDREALRDVVVAAKA